MNIMGATADTGIVRACRFTPDGCASLVSPEALTNALADTLAHGDGWIWLHFSLADNRCRDFIEHQVPLSAAARELLQDTDEHLRLDVLGEELVGVLPDLHQEFSHEGDDLVRLHIAMTDRLLVTARRKPVHSIERLQRAMESGRRFPSAVSFLNAIVDQFAAAMETLAERLGDELDAVEKRIAHDDVDDDRRAIGRIRLQAIGVRRQLAQLRGLFQRIDTRMEHEPVQIAFAVRALAQRFDSLDHEIGSLYERARLLQDEIAARMAEISNRRLFTLSILTACLLPPTLVTGFFGMNTRDLPFQTTDSGTWYALGVAALAAIGSYWLLKRLRAL